MGSLGREIKARMEIQSKVLFSKRFFISVYHIALHFTKRALFRD